MNKNEIFTFIAPNNGAEVDAVVLDKSESFDAFTDLRTIQYLCYAQNRLVYYYEVTNCLTGESEEMIDKPIVDYCVIPEYDSYLEAYKDHLESQTETFNGM